MSHLGEQWWAKPQGDKLVLCVGRACQSPAGGVLQRAVPRRGKVQLDVLGTRKSRKPGPCAVGEDLSRRAAEGLQQMWQWEVRLHPYCSSWMAQECM